MTLSRKFTDEQIRAAREQSSSFHEMAELLGVSHSTASRYSRVLNLQPFTKRGAYHRNPISDEQLLAAYNKHGSCHKASEALGYSYSSIATRLKKMGVDTSIAPWSPPIEDILELRKQGETYVAIGEQYGVSHTTVRRYLIRKELEMSKDVMVPGEEFRVEIIDHLIFRQYPVWSSWSDMFEDAMLLIMWRAFHGKVVPLSECDSRIEAICNRLEQRAKGMVREYMRRHKENEK